MITLTNARVLNNGQHGIPLDGVHSLLQILGTQNEVSGNRLSGVDGSTSGVIVIESADIHDNCGWGIRSPGRLVIRTWAKVNHNGRGGGCDGGGIQFISDASIQAATAGVEFIEVMNNGRDGIAAGGVDQSFVDLRNARVLNNARSGISIHNQGFASLEILGTQNEVSGNGRAGISLTTGGAGGKIKAEGMVIRDNCWWGIDTNADVEIVESATIENNGQRSGCNGGGIRGKTSVSAENTTIRQNRGDGITTGILSAGNLTVRENTGNGIVSPDVVIEGGLVCGNGRQEIKGCEVQGKITPPEIVSEVCPGGP